MFDVAIIGSGVGGMSTALYTARAGLKTIVIERGMYGGALNDTNEVENYIGTGKVKGHELAENMYNQMINNENVEYMYGNVQKIEKNDDFFTILTKKGSILSKTVVISTGVKHKKLNIKGEEEYNGVGVSYCAVCDGNFFKGKRITVIGGGDSAFEEGSYLAEIASHVTLVYRKGRGQIRAQKLLQDRFESKNNTSVETGLLTDEIVGKDGKVVGIVATDSFMYDQKFIETDGVFVYVGVEPTTSFLKDNNSEILNDEGYIVVNENKQTDIKGLFAVGDVTANSMRQIATAVGDGAIASKGVLEHIATNFRMNYE